MSYPFSSLGFVTVTTAGTPVPMSANTFPCRNFTVQGFKSKGTANTGDVYIYDNSPTKKLLYTIATGASFSPGPCGLQGGYDLSSLYVDAANNGDGLLITGSL